MLLRLVVLFGDNLFSNFKILVVEVYCKLKVVEVGFMYELKFVFLLGSVEVRVGLIDVKWLFKILYIFVGFVKELLLFFSLFIEELLVYL